MMMKTLMVVAALTLTAAAAHATNNNNGPVCVGRDACTTTTVNNKGGNASARQSQGQGQLQGQHQSQANSQSTSVNIDNPWATLGVVLGSSNNSPCGRTFFGIPASGHNCTVRMEAQAIYQSLAPMYGKKAAARGAVHHLCANDRTMRSTLVAIGACKLK